MAKLKLIDTKDKFLLEIDGTEIPYVTSYQITRTVGEVVLLKLALSVADVESVEIVSDKITNEKQEATDKSIDYCRQLNNAKKDADYYKQQADTSKESYRNIENQLAEEKNKNFKLTNKVQELENRPIEVAVAEPSDNERRLNETIKALERENIKHYDELEEEYRNNEKIVRKQLEDEKQEALRKQKEEYEERLQNVQTADGSSDDKDVFKAYFSIAYDSFVRMLDFAKQSQDKEFFKGKVEHLIEALATQNINL